MREYEGFETIIIIYGRRGFKPGTHGWKPNTLFTKIFDHMHLILDFDKPNELFCASLTHNAKAKPSIYTNYTILFF